MKNYVTYILSALIVLVLFNVAHSASHDIEKPGLEISIDYDNPVIAVIEVVTTHIETIPIVKMDLRTNFTDYARMYKQEFNLKRSWHYDILNYNNTLTRLPKGPNDLKSSL